MCATSASERRDVARAIRRAARIVLVTHIHADGDGLGSMAALARAGERAGKTVEVVSPTGVPRRYAFLYEGRTPPATADGFAALADAADLILVIDTCATAQLEPIAGALAERREKVAVIDHHRTRDDLSATVWSDPSAAAAGVMVAELLDELDWSIDAPTAEAIATAVCTDTGWLRHSNTDARALAVVGRMIDAGVRPDVLYVKLYHCDRPERLALTATALGSLTLHAGGRVSLMVLTRADFARTGATDDETEDIVNEGLRVATADVSILLVERGDGLIRASLRGTEAADVAAIARPFGGGGHARAAGARLPGPIAIAAERLVAACTEALS